MRKIGFQYKEAVVVLALYLILAPLLWGQTGPDGSAAADSEIPTGPAVGEMIPSFQAPDQYEKMQDLSSIRGPKGAMIVFFRSADW